MGGNTWLRAGQVYGLGEGQVEAGVYSRLRVGQVHEQVVGQVG